MIYISDEILDRFIKEDVPYLDLTTLVLGIGAEPGEICFAAREETVLCGTEEAARIFAKLGVGVVEMQPSGSIVQPGEIFLHGAGNAAGLHQVWKVALNILEYASGIATRTWKLRTKAQKINPEVELVTTRKVFPGTKELAIKAIVAGGAFPHRLGLSETILVFTQHLNFCGGIEGFIENLALYKQKAYEKKIIVETTELDEAVKLAQAGVDALQFDKVSPSRLQEIVRTVRAVNPAIVLIGAGGINDSNVEAYAETGVDVLNTTSPYFGKPSDIAVTIQKK